MGIHFFVEKVKQGRLGDREKKRKRHFQTEFATPSLLLAMPRGGHRDGRGGAAGNAPEQQEGGRATGVGGDDADEIGEELAPPTAEEMAKEEGVTPSPITESPFPQGPAIQPVVTESKEIPVDSKEAEDLFSDAPEQKTSA